MIVGYIETLCTKCRKPIWVSDNKIEENKIHECGGELIPMELSHEDYITLCEATTSVKNTDLRVNWDLYNAMVELKKNDIIEYNLKMSQFRNQVEQQKSSKTQNDTTPRCPHCKSTNIKSISVLDRGASIAMLGVFSKKINKSFECLNCKYTW